MKTLALFYPGCIEFEIMLACQLLNSTYPLEIVTPDGHDHIGSNGVVFKADASAVSADTSECKVLLVPGGNPDGVIDNTSISDLIRECAKNGSIVGAICAGPALLERASLLKGRRIAHGYKEPQLRFFSENEFFKETVLTDETLISDRGLVTARPDSFIDFAIEIARLAGVISDTQVPYLRQYYRGNP